MTRMAHMISFNSFKIVPKPRDIFKEVIFNIKLKWLHGNGFF